MLIALTMVAAACTFKRESRPKPLASAVQPAGPATFKPSSEPGILLPTSPEMTATWGGKRVILKESSGGQGCFGPFHSTGIYVTDDGLVFSYVYESPDLSSEDGATCEIRRYEAYSPEWYACLLHDSKLRAKLEPTLLGALELDLARVTDSERLALAQGNGGDYFGTVLQVPVRGDERGPLTLASCSDITWQVNSPEANWIFTVFRRLRRALGLRWIGNCPTREVPGDRPTRRSIVPLKEITPGVLGWWWSYDG